MDWLLISILIVIVILAIVVISICKKNKRPIDYYNLFIIGITWFAIGIPLKNPFLFILGLGFLIFGLINRNKWKANKRRWNNLNIKEKKIRILIMIILGLLVLAGFIMWFIYNK